MYNQEVNYQLSSHSSFFAFAVVGAAPPSPCSFPTDPVSAEAGVTEFDSDDATGPLRIAVVPITSDRELLRWCCPFRSCVPRDEKSSQKSRRSGSMRDRAPPARPSSGPSTKRLNWSAAPRTPVWRFWPRVAAWTRAWAAKSDSASC